MNEIDKREREKRKEYVYQHTFLNDRKITPYEGFTPRRC
jgi:hypothetical protein